MRFLVDVQLPPDLAVWLRSKGHDATHVFERLDARADDREIARLAASERAVVISKDADFLDLISGENLQLVWVRTGNAANPYLLARFDAEFPRVIDALSRGDTVVEIA